MDTRSSVRQHRAFLHRRVLLVFLFSIALPGLYLSYVGLRSIVQEQELQRGLLAQSVARSLEFGIDRFEQRLEQSEEKVARNLLVSTSPFHPPTLDRVNTLQPWIEQVFVFDSLLNLRSPLPFVPEGLAQRGTPMKGNSFQTRIDSAERLELQRDYGAALSSYQQLLAEDLPFRGKITVNAYLARSAAAIGNQTIARRAYNAIIETDSTFLISQPIPYAAFAWLEIVDDLVKQGQMSAAAQKLMQFHQRLLDFYYRFSSDQHGYLLQKVHSQVGQLEKSPKLLSDVKSSLNSLAERELLFATTLGQAEAIESWLKRQKGMFYVQNSSGTVSHHSLLIGGRSTPVSLIVIDGPSSLHHVVALVIRPEEVRREFLSPGLQSGDLGDDFNITIRADSSEGARQMELVSSRMHRTAALFPSLVVSVSTERVSRIEILGVQTSLLSVGFGLLVVGVILLGIFIIYRDIHREEELSRMKSEFISNVSHELKTPIAAIRMLADNLQESRVTEETRKAEYYQLISKEGARLSHLIDNILDFSRIEEKRKSFLLEKHNISGVVSETVRQFESLMEGKSQTISTMIEEDLPEVLADPEALALALFNLLDNAVKYSERKTQIDVRVHKCDGAVCIEVEDRGVGISKKDQENIFEKFYRVQQTDGKKIPGSGIGLALVKEIVVAHKGRVELRSELGVGSTFRILLPIGG